MAAAVGGWSFKYDPIKANADLFVNYGQDTQHNVFIERNHQNQTSGALKYALKVRNVAFTINEQFESKTIQKLAEKALANPCLKNEYNMIKKSMEYDTKSVNISRIVVLGSGGTLLMSIDQICSERGIGIDLRALSKLSRIFSFNSLSMRL